MATQKEIQPQESGGVLYPELFNFWFEKGPEITQAHAGNKEFLVIVVTPTGPTPEYYSDEEEAIRRARELAERAFFIPLP